MKIKITHTSYPGSVPVGSVMTVISKEPNGAVNATLDGDDFEWFISAGSFYVIDEIKMEVGKTYELNNGEVYACECMHEGDSLAVDDCRFGPFVLNGCLYHQDGRFADCGADDELSVKRCVSVDKPKTWRDMTDAEKGALLLAKHDGKVIEMHSTSMNVWYEVNHTFSDHMAYRVKPETKQVEGSDTFFGVRSDKFTDEDIKYIAERVSDELKRRYKDGFIL